MTTTKQRRQLAANTDHYTAPIRTYAEVVAAMRAKGDMTITISMIHWYEQSAFKKLRPLLEGVYDATGN